MPSEHSSSPRPSTIAAYSFAIVAALEQRGVDPKPVFDQAGISLQTTTDPMLRLTNREVSQLFKASVEATGDPAFGLLVGNSLHPGNLHALGYALMASTSLRDFCLRLQNYYKLVSQSAQIRTEETPHEFLLIATILHDDICVETQDAFATLMIRFMRFIHPSFNPLRLGLIRPRPQTGVQVYYDFFGCDIDFDQAELVIAIAPAIVDTALPGASKELAQMHDQTTMQYLRRLDKQDIINRVRSMIIEELSSAITKQRVADRLCMSARSLQLKLAAKNTSFQEILDGTRRDLALSYMEQSAISITEAAFLLGFSDVSNFTRAFKRWTGKSPRDYRQALGLHNV